MAHDEIHISEDTIKFNNLEYSEWKCQLFGGGELGMTWTPLKGDEPNWFWRWMQYLCFGNRWIKDDT